MIIRILLVTIMVLVAGTSLAEEPAKKIIEWGRDGTDTKFVRENIERTAAPDVCRRHVEAGFGIRIDCRWRQVGWNLGDFSQNHFTLEDVQTAVRAALDVSDEYIGLDTEQPRWRTNERLPTEYVKALRQAREPHRNADRLCGAEEHTNPLKACSRSSPKR